GVGGPTALASPPRRRTATGRHRATQCHSCAGIQRSRPPNGNPLGRLPTSRRAPEEPPHPWRSSVAAERRLDSLYRPRPRPADAARERRVAGIAPLLERDEDRLEGADGRRALERRLTRRAQRLVREVADLEEQAHWDGCLERIALPERGARGRSLLWREQPPRRDQRATRGAEAGL